MTDDDPKKVAIKMMGQLKRDEEELTAQVKAFVKKDKFNAKTVFSINVEGWTPFHAFTLRGCRKLVKLSLKAGVNVDLEMGQPEGLPGGCSALHLASHRGDVSIIDLLLTNGAEVNKKDDSNNTPVYYASRANNTLAVKRLLRAGADISTCDPDNKPSIDDMPSTAPFCFLPFGFGSQKRKRST